MKDKSFEKLSAKQNDVVGCAEASLHFALWTTGSHQCVIEPHF